MVELAADGVKSAGWRASHPVDRRPARLASGAHVRAQLRSLNVTVAIQQLDGRQFSYPPIAFSVVMSESRPSSWSLSRHRPQRRFTEPVSSREVPHCSVPAKPCSSALTSAPEHCRKAKRRLHTAGSGRIGSTFCHHRGAGIAAPDGHPACSDGAERLSEGRR